MRVYTCLMCLVVSLVSFVSYSICDVSKKRAFFLARMKSRIPVESAKEVQKCSCCCCKSSSQSDRYTRESKGNGRRERGAAGLLLLLRSEFSLCLGKVFLSNGNSFLRLRITRPCEANEVPVRIAQR